MTCYEPESQLCFVQDETAGVYVFPSPWPKDLKFGDVVEVQGGTAKGRFSPVVYLAAIRATGERNKPVEKRVAIEQLNTGTVDAQWVQIEGVVQMVEFGSTSTRIEIRTGGSSANVLAFGYRSSPTNLIDATVRAEGVAGTFYRDNQLTGFGLFLNTPEDLKVISAAPPAFDGPARSLGNLAWYSRGGGLDHRVKIEGIATVVWPDEAIFLQDKSGAIRVKPMSAGDLRIQAGDLVEATGFIRDLNSVPWVYGGLVRKKSTDKVPVAPPVPIRQLHAQPASGELVTTEGTLLRVRKHEKLTLLDVESEKEIVTALCPGDVLKDLQTGSRLHLVGAWSKPPSALSTQLGSVLWLNSQAGVVLIAPPKASALPGSARNAPIWIASTVAALLAAGVILLQSRKKMVRFAEQTVSGATRLADMERELQRLNEARERLGRDLHDRIIQSIYALGLNIDDCAQTLQLEPDKAKTRLRGALTEVNGVIAELRNVILGLETNAIQPRELRTALKSLALALGHEESNRIRVSIDEEAVAVLSPAQATELVHIAREALSNSIRHGAAQTTTFRLELRDERIRFSIEDDGRGFDVKAAQRKGFGLRNMAKRAEHLGALFSISSEAGHGTRVLLDISRQKQHFSLK